MKSMCTQSPDRQEPDKNRRRRLISVGATTIFPSINLSLINIWTKYARACPNCKTVFRLRLTLFRSEGISLGVFSLRCISTALSKDLYNSYYDDHNFTFLTDKMPDLKQVVNTNKCLLYLEKHDNKLLIVSVIDNLLKGASGQAVHNMNLLFGLHERVGLHLKPSAF